jgi:YbbR-like protein
MVERTLSSLVALSLALLVWLYARSRDQEILDNTPIPVHITLPPDLAEQYHLELSGPAQVLASFTGPPLRIRELRGILQHNELSVDVTMTIPEERLNEGRYSDTVVVESSDIHAPAGVTPLVLEGRNRIPVMLHRVVERRLPVRFEHNGDDPNLPVVIEPPTVLVRGPQEVLDKVRAVPTQLSEMPPYASSLRVDLLQELERRAVQVTPSRVTVRVPAKAAKLYELPDVPVHFLCPPNYALRPKFIDDRAGRVTLRVQGPAQDEPPKVRAFIDLTRGGFVQGMNHEPIQLQLPKDFQLAQEPPREAGFELAPVEFSPKTMGRVPSP